MVEKEGFGEVVVVKELLSYFMVGEVGEAGLFYLLFVIATKSNKKC
jgi:hypothetical protein